MQLGQANLGMAPCGERQEEHAQAAQNADRVFATPAALRHAEGSSGNQDEGSQFRNNYVNLEKMKGRVKVYPDEDKVFRKPPSSSARASSR